MNVNEENWSFSVECFRLLLKERRTVMSDTTLIRQMGQIRLIR